MEANSTVCMHIYIYIYILYRQTDPTVFNLVISPRPGCDQIHLNVVSLF